MQKRQRDRIYLLDLIVSLAIKYKQCSDDYMAYDGDGRIAESKRLLDATLRAKEVLFKAIEGLESGNKKR